MPMPVSETANSTKLRPLLTLRAASLTSPALVNLQALLRRLRSICRSRMGSTVNAPRFSWASTTRRFLFCSASCPAVPMTSLISGASCTVCGLSSSFPASIFERSRTWLMSPRRCVPARFTRCSGSCAFSVPKRAAFLTIISVSPMMALSGVRSSWLTLETNCDLCSLASASCRFLSWISSNSRTFSMAITACSANVFASFLILDEIAARREKALIFLESLELQEHLALMIKNRYGLKRRPMQINGDVAGEKRQALVDAFQTERGTFDVMILSPRAGGVGLTLTSANNIIHLSRWWNPAVEDQCTDRVYRIGQDQIVHVYYPMAVHPLYGDASFDELLNTLLTR